METLGKEEKSKRSKYTRVYVGKYIATLLDYGNIKRKTIVITKSCL